MSNGEYTVETVKIMMVTNIPNKEPIPFTSDVLYHPFLEPNLGKYKLKKYPSVVTEGLLYDTTLLNQLDYSRRVRFFFEPDYMRKKLAELNRNGGMTVKETDKETDDKTDVKVDIKVLNIEIMIKLLFQTKFPIIENVGNSYCRNIIKNDPDCNRVGFTAKGTVPQFIIALAPGLFKGLETYFSYLKTDGTVYTITKTIWLNDIINNPLYRGLIDQFNTFRKWREKEGMKIIELYEKQKKILVRDANIAFGKSTLALLKNLSEKANTLKNQRGNQDFTNQQLINYIVDFMNILLDSSKDDKMIYDIVNEMTILVSEEILTKIGLKKSVFMEYKSNPKNNKYRDISDNDKVLIKDYISKLDKLTKFEEYKFIANIINNSDTSKEITIKLSLDNITNLRSLYNDLTKNNISIREDIRKKINPVFDKAKRVDNLDTIYTKYFENDININFEDDDESVRTLLKTNYGEYVKFVENLKKFITPNKESNNKMLQSLIEDYIEGSIEDNSKEKTSKNFPATIEQISRTFLGKHVHKRVDKKDNISDYVKVDYTTTETITEGEPKTELYLAVDVVKGELTDTNLRKVTCNYRGEELTDRFDHIRKKWAYNPFEIDKKRLFFDFEKVLAAKEPVKKGKGEAGPLPPPPPQKGGPPGIAAAPPPPPAILAQGGKKYTRNKKVRRMRNHHITQRMRR
jgi:hypothetical protein